MLVSQSQVHQAIDRSAADLVEKNKGSLEKPRSWVGKLWNGHRLKVKRRKVRAANHAIQLAKDLYSAYEEHSPKLAEAANAVNVIETRKAAKKAASGAVGAAFSRTERDCSSDKNYKCAKEFTLEILASALDKNSAEYINIKYLIRDSILDDHILVLGVW